MTPSPGTGGRRHLTPSPAASSMAHGAAAGAAPPAILDGGEQLAIVGDAAGPVGIVPDPVPEDAFLTLARRSWMVVGRLITRRPTQAEVGRLIDQSGHWDDHDRVENCLRISNHFPLLWQEFLVQETFRMRESRKREREAIIEQNRHADMATFVGQQKARRDNVRNMVIARERGANAAANP